MSKCAVRGCYEDGPCALGEAFKGKCPHFGAPEEGSTANPVPSGSPFPWNGHLLGSDLTQLTARGRPRIIGLIGHPDAGKTTFLTTLYGAVLAGKRILEMPFAGSVTLAAWEELASWTRPRVGRPGKFPPRTSSSLTEAGFLHLAFRTKQGAILDLLFTDAPGEWFRAWASNAKAPNAIGATRISMIADAFLLMADSHRLSGKDRGTARGELLALMERLGTERNGRPAGFVWSKSDQVIPTDFALAIEQERARILPGSSVFRTNFRDFEAVYSTVNSIVGESLNTRSRAMRTSAREGPPFFAYRGGPYV